MSTMEAPIAMQDAQNRAEIETFLSLLPTPVVTIDRDRRVAALNEAATRCTGWEPQAIIGQPCSAMLQAEVCPACEAWETGTTQREATAWVERPGGERVPMTVDAVPLGEPGVVVLLREDPLRAALRRAGGCVTRAARLLNVHRTTVWRRMREQGIDRGEFLPA
jgi:transcriptional regulator with PAS, ATPase and Fis domain